MRKIIFILGLTLSCTAFSQGIVTNGSTAPNLTARNPFLDGSTSFSNATSGNNNLGKGLVFPDTDLTTFQFVNLDELDGLSLPTAFDGMVVYNTGTGNTSTAQVTTVTAVTPGFYYFSNPSSVNQGGTSVAGGVWKPLSSSATGNFWSPTGNTGTTAGTNFVGTTDAQNVVFKSNSASTTAGYNPTKVIMGNATDTPTFTKIVIGGTVAQQAPSIAAKTRNVQPAGQATAANFDFAMEVYGKSWFADGIVTSASTYPDYVFDNYFTGTSKVNPTYQFKSLAETEKFIKENNHLPGVTKIDDLAKGGNGYMIDATQLSVQSLEKIEELYLHTIEQQKQIDELKAQVAELKALLKK